LATEIDLFFANAKAYKISQSLAPLSLKPLEDYAITKGQMVWNFLQEARIKGK
jgi:hypothetical protein